VSCGTEQWCVVLAKSADESTTRPLLAISQQKPLTAYTDCYCAHDPVAEDEKFDRE
jgi:transposase-like protein